MSVDPKPATRGLLFIWRLTTPPRCVTMSHRYNMVENMNELIELLAELVAEEKIALACNVLGKNINDYSHLDRGRQAMTGGNLLRNAIKKQEDVLPRAVAAARAIVAARPSDFKKESSEKRKSASHDTPPRDSTPEWKPTDADFDRWEQAYFEDERLRAEGKLPPRRLSVVATTDEMMIFGTDGSVKYHCKRTPKHKGVTKIAGR